MRQGFQFIETPLKPTTASVEAPVFLVHLDPWFKVFFRNFRDAIWPRRQESLQLSSQPSEFWADVFVQSRLPWGRFAESVVFHTAVVAALWGTARLWPQRVQVVTPVAFHSSDVVYYQPEEYLPVLDTGGAKPEVAAKADAAYSPQPIISVPPDADNRRQTIVTPPNLKLEHDVALPNVIAWNHERPAIPTAAAQRHTSDLKLPTLSTTVVAPAPELERALSKSALPVPQAAVVAPAPGVELASSRRLSDINIGHAEVVAPAPQLPMEEQHTLRRTDRGEFGNPGGAVVPPPPSVQGAGAASQDGRLIALSLQPASVTGPVQVPEGNRRGAFAATPEGRPGASGTPESIGTKNDTPTGDAKNGRSNAAGNGSGHSTTGIPSGLFVGGHPPGASVSAVGSSGSGSGAADPSPLVARVVPPSGSVPRKLASEMSPDQETDAERKVFSTRKSYAMTLNLPNLNSAGGSWVMHFSELEQEKPAGDLYAPVATSTVDPGYPLELMRENVRGTVTLSAVIRSDGSVGDVQVVNSIDDRLDDYARNALLRWRFLPALRNGNPVALQAIVMIPFRPRQKVGF